jgi:hypothetical protein
VGVYSDEVEGLVGVARELTYAYIDARNEADAMYAADAIAEFLLEREALPGEALIALLDVPLDGRTHDLLHKAAGTLTARGTEVAGMLLEAALSKDSTAARVKNAAAILDDMDERERIDGFVNVLRGREVDHSRTPPSARSWRWANRPCTRSSGRWAIPSPVLGLAMPCRNCAAEGLWLRRSRSKHLRLHTQLTRTSRPDGAGTMAAQTTRRASRAAARDDERAAYASMRAAAIFSKVDRRANAS